MIKFFIFRLVDLVNLVGHVLVRSEHAYALLYFNGFDNLRQRMGIYRAWRNFEHAYKTVEAYRKFININGGFPRINLNSQLLPDLSVIPETDKENYVKKYSNEQRVVGGVLPQKGVMIDESSGSSGHPTSWVRGSFERVMTKRMIQLGFHKSQQEERAFVINAFALGAWATGLNVSISLSDITILKSTGPDIDKIIHTLEEFGPKYDYIVMGYPPFLKTLADDKRIDWEKYSVSCAYGGEGISESLRDYLLKKFKRVIGSYGASDLEINMAAENDFTIALRRLILTNAKVRDRLIKKEYGVTPMIFQYNPLVYYIETNNIGEMVVTLTRPYNIAPKIRYNIHDRGTVMPYKRIRQILESLGVWEDFKKTNPLHLPLLFFYGRSDMSVDYYGANVTPDGVREVLYKNQKLSKHMNTFKLLSVEDSNHNKNMIIQIELTEGSDTKMIDKASIEEQVFPELANINRDFYNAYYNTASKDNLPKIELHQYKKGPFENSGKKLKNEYVTAKIKYDSLNR